MIYLLPILVLFQFYHLPHQTGKKIQIGLKLCIYDYYIRYEQYKSTFYILLFLQRVKKDLQEKISRARATNGGGIIQVIFCSNTLSWSITFVITPARPNNLPALWLYIFSFKILPWKERWIRRNGSKRK